MNIRKKDEQEIQRELGEIQHLVTTHWLEIPSLKTQDLQLINQEKIRKILYPENEDSYKELVSALRKTRFLENKLEKLKKDEMLLIITKKVMKDRFLSYSCYGDGDAESLSTKFDPLTKNINKLSIIRETDNGFIDMEIPESVTKPILSYMKEMEISAQRCFYFMCYMFGFPQLIRKFPEKYADPIRDIHFTYTYQQEDLLEKDLKCGDKIGLYKYGNPKHHAIYLKDGLFISKLGLGTLSLNTLAQLHNIYNTDKFYREDYAFNDPDLYNTSHPMPAVETRVDEIQKDLKTIWEQ